MNKTKRTESKLAKLALGASSLAVLLGASACLDRPIGREQPRTTNVIVDQLVQDAVDKIDLLFVVDNSISMADKQAILAEALPDLVGRLVSPTCITANGQGTTTPESANENCPSGSAREFNPIKDIHIGVITTSLGGYGAAVDCRQRTGIQSSEQAEDMAHLLATLPRGAAAAPSAAGSGFLSWTANSVRGDFVREFADLVQESGEFGCGWEATMESWYRFLVDPYPYEEVVRQQCPGRNDPEPGLCAGPRINQDGTLAQDYAILTQRRQFLRPDSLLAVVMLSDENDCSFRASGQTWRLAQTITSSGGFSPAFRGTAACNDPAFGANDDCCHSCGSNPPPGCPSEQNAEGQTVAVGCAAGRQYPADGVEDHPNLRCFQQKRRFGVDYLYPVERYSNALQLRTICPFKDDLAPADDGTCPGGALAEPNPLYADLTFNPADPDAVEKLPRPQSLIFLAGIVGVPWQDVAVSANPNEPLVYKVARPDAPEAQRIDWSWLIGDRYPEDGIPKPLDPLMIESVEARSGTNPATNEAIAPPASGYMANSINGHEWNIDNSDLQYACIFPQERQEDCISREEYISRRDMGEAVPNCDCTDYGGASFQNPLCQQSNGSYGARQTHAKAYPSLRQLQVLHDYGANSIVASICPKETNDRNASDYGYRPAVAAIIDRLKEQLADKCLMRELSVRKNAQDANEAACIIVEAKRVAAGTASCNNNQARKDLNADIAEVVRRELRSSDHKDANAYQLCEIVQLTSDVDPDGYETCLTQEVATGHGWCYVDPAKGLPANPMNLDPAPGENLVEKCPPTAKRKLRFIGDGTPEAGTVTLVACAGAAFTE